MANNHHPPKEKPAGNGNSTAGEANNGVDFDTDLQIPPIGGIHQAVTNPRQRRALLALLNGPVSREQLDRITGASNSPSVIQRLRCKGFEIPCSSTEATDRDGRPCQPGAYSLTDADKARALALLADQPEVAQ